MYFVQGLQIIGTALVSLFFWFSFVECRFSIHLHTQAVLPCCYFLEKSRAAIFFLNFPTLLASLSIELGHSVIYYH
jgi:hypothetical protein